jgi:hypothetical protein
MGLFGQLMQEAKDELGQDFSVEDLTKKIEEKFQEVLLEHW